MENLITVDLNKNVIIPIKEPFDKRELAHFVADYFGYEKGEIKVEHKVFDGNFEEFQTFAFENDNVQIIQINDNSVNYQETIIVPYEKSKTEFGIERYLKPSTDALIKMLTEAQVEVQKKAIEEAKENLELQKKAIEDGLQTIRDINLS